MGETSNQPFQLSFNPALRVEFQGSRVTSDGGLILVRKLDERLGLSDLIARHLTDPRGTNTHFPLADLSGNRSRARLLRWKEFRNQTGKFPRQCGKCGCDYRRNLCIREAL